MNGDRSALSKICKTNYIIDTVAKIEAPTLWEIIAINRLDAIISIETTVVISTTVRTATVPAVFETKVTVIEFSKRNPNFNNGECYNKVCATLQDFMTVTES